MSRKTVNFKGISFNIDTSGDHYGLEFWESLEKRLWEPDTLDFLEREIGKDTLLFDIGAANGSICLIAASLGARVVAFEPNPTIFEVCRTNLNLNPEIRKNVTLEMSAISSTDGFLTFEAGSNSQVVSDISVGIHSDSNTTIPILSLSKVLHDHCGNAQKVLIKMDIEGAEFKILHDKKSLESMKQNNVKLLLAIHPGFYKPIHPTKFLRGLRTKLFTVRNFFEAVRVFNLVTQYGAIYRTNLNPIKSSKIFGALVISSYHEFVIDFNTH